MPVLNSGRYDIDYSDDGAGSPVVLIHSSACGNTQWRRLIADLQDGYRVVALNRFGYGRTTPWPDGPVQTLDDQAALVAALAERIGVPLHLVGHSFGGAVAMKAALELSEQVSSLILLEPNPFYLLARHGRDAAFAEIKALRDDVKTYGGAGDWAWVGRRFADYWNGEGAWSAMSRERRSGFLRMLPPNYHEWDGVMNETTHAAAWRDLAARTLLVHAAGTKRPIKEIAEILLAELPGMAAAEIPEGGHMAPLVRPDLVNPVVRDSLDAMS
jgi:pimeloyl-ACP methyl ester carboxylesterase